MISFITHIENCTKLIYTLKMELISILTCYLRCLGVKSERDDKEKDSIEEDSGKLVILIGRHGTIINRILEFLFFILIAFIVLGPNRAVELAKEVGK